MAPYKALYGQKCRSPLCWTELSERTVLGPDLVDATTEKIEVIKQKVTPTIGIGRSIKAKKLSPRFLGPLEILERIGEVAYSVALPSHLSNVHNVFHMSQLKKYHPDPSHILELEEVELDDNLTYQAELERILDVKDKQLRNKTIQLVKVFWKGMSLGDATWETEERIQREYPLLFS
ncbi:uncharacterized protein LOC114762023 [Neltuma alba]|uniref:uncharacterized protein LOC114762023 n=1 Tax=Neltuma alba TaxID=207710 RepID=UPI0010A4E42F|nr:uncharacterized protein LOC114762023 [Prosopis alba]